jgi:hypothetical protein
MSILDMDIDGLIFETFTWNFHHTRAATGHGPSDRHPGAGAGSSSAAAAGFGVGAGYVGPLPSQAAAGSGTQPSTSAPAAATTSTFPPPPLAVGGSGAFDVSGLPLTPAGGMSELSTPTGAQAPAAASASPFAAADQDEAMMTSIPLKPGGNHLKVCCVLCPTTRDHKPWGQTASACNALTNIAAQGTGWPCALGLYGSSWALGMATCCPLQVTNHNKREYVLLKAHKMLVGTIEAQMTAVIDAFHSVIPRWVHASEWHIVCKLCQGIFSSVCSFVQPCVDGVEAANIMLLMATCYAAPQGPDRQVLVHVSGDAAAGVW